MVEVQQRRPGNDGKEQRQRRDDEADKGDRQRIGERRDERKLLKEQEHQRQTADRYRPLRGAPLRERRTPATGLAKARRANKKEQTDSAERQPEAGRQHGPRIKHQHHQQGEQQRSAGAKIAPRPQGERDDRQHVQRALRGYSKAGEQRIAERRQPAGDNGGLLRRQKQHQALAASPQPAGQCGKQGSQHRHMQTGYRHEVGNPGTVENYPLRPRDHALVADGQCNQHAYIRRIGQHAGEAIANRVTQPFNGVIGARHKGIETLRFALRPHVTRGANAALEQPGLVVKTMRIGVAVRALEANGKPPALAGTNGTALMPLIVLPAVIPGEHDAFRDDRRMCRRGCLAGNRNFSGLNDKLKALTALEALRQCGDNAGHLNVAPFPSLRQLVCQTPLRQPRRPGKTEQRAAQKECCTRRPVLATNEEEDAEEGDGTGRRNKARVGQISLQLEKADANGKSEDDRPHALIRPVSRVMPRSKSPGTLR